MSPQSDARYEENRRVIASLVASSRAEQGLGATIEDPLTLVRIATAVRANRAIQKKESRLAG